MRDVKWRKGRCVGGIVTKEGMEREGDNLRSESILRHAE